MMACDGLGWCAGKNVFPSLMHAGMQLSIVGVGLPGLTGCMLLCSVLVPALFFVCMLFLLSSSSSLSISLIFHYSLGVFMYQLLFGIFGSYHAA